MQGRECHAAISGSNDINMTKKNFEQSIRHRLLNISRQRNEAFQFLLTRYALERLLYRISKSRYADQFVLKGAMLFMAWTNKPYRPTRDLDLLGYGDFSLARLTNVFIDICKTNVQSDGLVFDTSSISATEIREEQEYGGQRVKLIALLGKAKAHLQVDIGFGDVITPDAEKLDFPTLLEMSPPRIQAYPKETVIAEKLQAAVVLDMQNSRMKDFYDLLLLSKIFPFNGDVLAKAIRATFYRRKTDFPAEVPISLTDEFAMDRMKQTQWQAFLRKNGIDDMYENLEVVIAELRKFLIPPFTAAAENTEFSQSWSPNGMWK